MKPYIVSISILVLVLVMTLQVGCSPSSESATTDTQQRIASLEKRVAELEGRTVGKQSPSQMLDKDIPEVGGHSFPELKDTQTLRFRLATGDRVEVEVTTTNGTGNFISTVRDPFGNVLSQSATKAVYWIDTSLESRGAIRSYLTSTQKYPWRFAFIAATSGDYTLDVNGSKSGAHLKVLINQ